MPSTDYNRPRLVLVASPHTSPERFRAALSGGDVASVILAAEGVNIQAISTSEIKVSCIVATKYTELAVRALHDGFGLGVPPSEE